MVSFRKEILAAFDDQSAQVTAEEYLDRFEDGLTQLLYEDQDQKNRMIDVMYDGRASRETIDEVVRSFTTSQLKAQESMLDLRSNLIELSHEDNWPKLAKALAKFV